METHQYSLESKSEDAQVASLAEAQVAAQAQTKTERSEGLYKSSYEHDACGIGAIAHLKGIKSHSTLDDALSVLVNLEHRGGKGLERNTGDGAGVLFQVPHRFFRKEAQKEGQLLPDEGDYGVAMLFFPHSDETGETDGVGDKPAVDAAIRVFEEVLIKEEIQDIIDELFNTLKENKYLNTEERLQIADNFFVFLLRYAFKNPSDKSKGAANDFRSLSDTLCELIKSRETASSIIEAIEHSSYYVNDIDFKHAVRDWKIEFDVNTGTFTGQKQKKMKDASILLLTRIEEGLHTKETLQNSCLNNHNKELQPEHIIPTRIARRFDECENETEKREVFARWNGVETSNPPTKENLFLLGNLVLLTKNQNSRVDNAKNNDDADRAFKWTCYANGMKDPEFGSRPAEDFVLIRELLDKYPLDKPFDADAIKARQEHLADYAVKYCRIYEPIEHKGPNNKPRAAGLLAKLLAKLVALVRGSSHDV